MSELASGTYFANYNDYNGFDEVPCMVDLDKLEVVSFDPATQLRRPVPDGTFVEVETIQLDDGRKFDAIKFDEYNDAVSGGYSHEYDRSRIILLDNDLLRAACGW